MDTGPSVFNCQSIALSALCTSRLSSPVFSGRAHNLFVCYLLQPMCHPHPPREDWMVLVVGFAQNETPIVFSQHGFALMPHVWNGTESEKTAFIPSSFINIARKWCILNWWLSKNEHLCAMMSFSLKLASPPRGSEVWLQVCQVRRNPQHSSTATLDSHFFCEHISIHTSTKQKNPQCSSANLMCWCRSLSISGHLEEQE